MLIVLGCGLVGVQPGFREHDRRSARFLTISSNEPREIAMDRDFTRQVARAKDAARATSRAQRAFRHADSVAQPGIAGAAYVVEKGKPLLTLVE